MIQTTLEKTAIEEIQRLRQALRECVTENDSNCVSDKTTLKLRLSIINQVAKQALAENPNINWAITCNLPGGDK